MGLPEVSHVGQRLDRSIGKVFDRLGSDRDDGAVDRSPLVAVQTPQAFRADVLRAAHAGEATATDDAALLGELADAYLRDLIESMQRFFFLGLDLGDFATEMRSEHEELIALLSSGSPDDAAACLSRQIFSSRDRILRALIEDRMDLPIE